MINFFNPNVSDFLGTQRFSTIKADLENQLLPLRSKYSSDTERFAFLGSILRDEPGLDADRRAVAKALSSLAQHLVRVRL